MHSRSFWTVVFSWFKQTDLEATQERPPVVYERTDPDEPVILKPGIDFRNDEENTVT